MLQFFLMCFSSVRNRSLLPLIFIFSVLFKNDVMKNICLLLIVIFSTVTSGFPSSPMTGWNDVYTRTHRDMLNSGLKKATGNYLKNKYLEDDLSNVPLREVVNVFFGNGQSYFECFLLFCMLCHILYVLSYFLCFVIFLCFVFASTE